MFFPFCSRNGYLTSADKADTEHLSKYYETVYHTCWIGANDFAMNTFTCTSTNESTTVCLIPQLIKGEDQKKSNSAKYDAIPFEESQANTPTCTYSLNEDFSFGTHYPYMQCGHSLFALKVDFPWIVSFEPVILVKYLDQLIHTMYSTAI